MPSYTRCNKDEATHLCDTDPTAPSHTRGLTFLIVHRVEDGCLVRKLRHGPHYFVRNCHASYYKEYVPPVVTFGIGYYTKYGGLDALVMGTGKWTTKGAAVECIVENTALVVAHPSFPKWTHIITYHDGKPVGIEESK